MDNIRKMIKSLSDGDNIKATEFVKATIGVKLDSAIEASRNKIAQGMMKNEAVQIKESSSKIEKL